MQPILQIAIGFGVGWLILIGLARLLASVPAWSRAKIPRDESRSAKRRGYLFTAITVAMLLVYFGWPWEPRPEAALAPVPVLVLVFGVVGVVSLGFGMATTARIDASVSAPDGTANATWATELLTRLSGMNADQPTGKVDRPSGGDLNDLLVVAGRSDNWFVGLVSSAVALLLNLAPWRLEVAVFDARHGVGGVLRRNGHIIGRNASTSNVRPPIPIGPPNCSCSRPGSRRPSSPSAIPTWSASTGRATGAASGCSQ